VPGSLPRVAPAARVEVDRTQASRQGLDERRVGIGPGRLAIITPDVCSFLSSSTQPDRWRTIGLAPSAPSPASGTPSPRLAGHQPGRRCSPPVGDREAVAVSGYPNPAGSLVLPATFAGPLADAGGAHRAG
jgi:hypothetical protein